MEKINPGFWCFGAAEGSRRGSFLSMAWRQ